MSPLAGMMIPHESYSICWEAAAVSGSVENLRATSGSSGWRCRRSSTSSSWDPEPGDPNRSQQIPGETPWPGGRRLSQSPTFLR